jgi:hypothetical protein
MKHSSSRELFAYWNERRGQRLAPERGDIEPGVIRKALGDTFILGHDPEIGHVFRLGGTRICALFGREVKGESFAGLFSPAFQDPVRDLLGIIAEEVVGVVAGATGATEEGETIELELLMLPLRHRGHTHARMIGVMTPVVTPPWLGVSRLVSMRLGHLRHVGPAVETVVAPRLVTPPPRRDLRHNLVVFQGGRS